MSLFTSLFRRPARTTLRRPRLALESLEAREVLSAAPITPPQDLVNPLVRQVADAEFVQSHGTLTRTDVINLMSVVDGTEQAKLSASGVSFSPLAGSPTGTVQPGQLTALQTLVKDAALWGLSPDVANLAGKVVNYDLANEHYQGQSLLPTGQLAAGDSKVDMVDLVDKWFLGTDLPSLAGFSGAQYELASGSLYGSSGTPNYNDVAQGAAADCYFMSSLGELALQSPQSIENMFINNHDGTYTVRFFGPQGADYVTVNKELPVHSDGQFYFAGYQQYGQPSNYKNGSNVLWVGLAEKAYAQLAEEGWSRNPNGPNFSSGFTDNEGAHGASVNAYSSLNDGTFNVLQQLTGRVNYTWWDFTAQGAEAKMEAAFAKGDMVIMSTPSSTPQGDPLIPFHVYMLEAVNTKAGTFTFVNPYDDGKEYSLDGARVVTLTWQQLEADASTFAYVPTGATA
jgi:hypothetical protein